MGTRTRIAVVVSLALWAVAAAGYVGLLVLDHNSWCPGLPDTSGFADVDTWRWLPPGRECTYHLSEGDVTTSPSPARLAVLGLLVLWPVMTVLLGRAAAADRRAAAPGV